MDKLTRELRKKNMQANKSSGTKPELILAKALFSRGHRYRKNNKTVFGKPDLTFKKIKLAIFVDGEFWHGKNWTIRKHDHKTNKDFWEKKIERIRYCSSQSQATGLRSEIICCSGSCSMSALRFISYASDK